MKKSKVFLIEKRKTHYHFHRVWNKDNIKNTSAFIVSDFDFENTFGVKLKHRKTEKARLIIW